MKVNLFSKQDFQNLNTIDRIEYLLRKNDVTKNIKKSFPIIEIFAILIVLGYSRVYNLMQFAAFGISADTIKMVDLVSNFANTLIVIFIISFIARLIIYFNKHKQLSELHREFLERIRVSSKGDKKNK
jgi:hypothetical protein